MTLLPRIAHQAGCRIALTSFALLVMGLGGPGCGYSLRGSDVAMLSKEGVRSLYIAPVENKTFRPGVEQIMYNSLVRMFAASTHLRIVGSKEEADAMLDASVSDADYTPSSTTTTSKIPPVGVGPDNRIVPVEYQATLACSLSIRKLSGKGLKPGASLWSAGFSRAQLFPANTQLGVLGTTTALINESEFERALVALAELISRDAGESLVATF
ncbi:MAG: hypothetical protein IT285_06645 [Bdellovibrionales bacterium]|nr:hypothetical protein [Bdellovibrionales bacterium]